MADVAELDKEEIVVAIDPPEAEKTAGEKPEVVAKVEAPKDPAVAELVKQYNDLEAVAKKREDERNEARRRAQTAEAETAKAKKEAETAKAQVVDSNLDTITTALQSAQARAEAAKREIKAAGEQGDYAAQTEAFDKLATAKAEILRYDEAKADLETRKSKKADEPAVEKPGDPVEAYISRFSDRTQEWMRDHKDYITDPKKSAKVTAAHYSAVANDLVPDTDEYFDFVERQVGLKKDPTEAVEVEARPAPKKTAVRPVAPVNAGGGSSGSGGTEVRLTQREATAATDGTHVWNYDDPSGKGKFKKGDPIGTQEMARRKLEMTKQGVYDRTYTDQ